MVLDLISAARVGASRVATPARQWTPLDTVLLFALVALAGGLRYVHITQPAAFVFDEHYAADACIYLFGPGGGCGFTSEPGVAHPPLGKWLIAAGIKLYGFNTAGWRLAPLAAGMLSVGLMYLLARRLHGSTLAAAIAAGLLTFDFLHFVMSRTAMLDIFVVTFGLASFLCLVYDCDRGDRAEAPSGSRAMRRLRNRRWLFGAGLAGGAALATKWSGGYLLLAVAVLAFLDAARRRAGAARYWRTVREEGVVLLIALVLLPAAVYVLSYAGQFAGPIVAWPWSDGSWLRSFVTRQQDMIAHHKGSLYVHPYMSAPGSWPFVQRPVLFYFRDYSDGRYQEILALGNPLVWWPGLLAIALTAWGLVRRPDARWRNAIILSGFIAGYLPWFIVTRRESFLYYFLPAVPFLYLAISAGVVRIVSKFNRTVVVTGLAIASISAFAFFWPVLAARPLPYGNWQRRIIFDDCGIAPVNGRKKPILDPRPSPGGWCWL